MSDASTPRAADGRDVPERTDRSIDELVPERHGPDVVPEVELADAVAANLPQGGLGARGPLDGGSLGPGEAALDRERSAQRAPTQRG